MDIPAIEETLFALTHMSYHAVGDDPNNLSWWADLDKDDIAKIGSLIAALEARAVAAEARVGELETEREIARIKGLLPDDAQRYFDERNVWADRAVAAEGRLKAATAALAPLFEKIAFYDGPQLRHWLGSQDVAGSVDSERAASIVHEVIRARAVLVREAGAS